SETVLDCARITRIVELLVFGAGAMGSFFGGLLCQRHDVTLIGRGEHISAIKSHGLRISGKTAIIAKPRAATRVPQNAKPEFVVVTTKSYDTANAMIALRPLGERAIFVTLQNGLGNADTIARTARRVIAGTTAHGVTFVGPGEIRHAGIGETVLGAKRTAANRASMLQDLDRHHRTEIDAITGSIVRAAERHRIPVPLNAGLYALVRAREAAFRAASA